MNPTRQVILALFVGGLVFAAAGDRALARAGKVGTLLGGNLTTDGTAVASPVNVRVVFGWAALAMFLIIGSELPGMGDLSVAFAWLIALSIFLTIGPAAFDNLSHILAGNVPTGGGGGGRKRK